MIKNKFKVGDAVMEPIWNGYDWKIESMYMSRGKLRAKLVSIIGQYEERDFFKGIIKKDKLAYCSEFIENLKLK